MRPGPESETGCGRDGEEEERSHQARAERHEDGTRVGRATEGGKGGKENFKNIVILKSCTYLIYHSRPTIRKLRGVFHFGRASRESMRRAAVVFLSAFSLGSALQLRPGAARVHASRSPTPALALVEGDEPRLPPSGTKLDDFLVL